MKDEWWFAVDGARKGPVKFEFLRGKVLDGSLSASDLVWTEGMSAWTAVCDVPALSQVIRALPPELPRSKAPKSPALSDTPKPAAPWRRFFARSIDIWVIAPPTGFLVVYLLAPVSPGFVLWLQQPGAVYILGFLIMPLVLVIETIIFATFGTTIGKGLLGIHLTTAASRAPTFLHYLYRQIGVYWYGFGTGFPFVSLFTMARQRSRLKAGLPTSYDEGLFEVTAEKIGSLRYLAAAAVVAVLVTANGILQMMSPTPNLEAQDTAAVSSTEAPAQEQQTTPATSPGSQPSNLSANDALPPCPEGETRIAGESACVSWSKFTPIIPQLIPDNAGFSTNVKGLSSDGKLDIEIFNNTSKWAVRSISVLLTDSQQHIDFINGRTLTPAHSEKYSVNISIPPSKSHFLEIKTSWNFHRSYFVNVDAFGYKSE